MYGVTDAITSADYRPVIKPVSKTKSWSEISIVGLNVGSIRNVSQSCYEQSARRRVVVSRSTWLGSGNWRIELPPQTEIQAQLWSRLPVVLTKEEELFGLVSGRGDELISLDAVGQSQQEGRKCVALMQLEKIDVGVIE